jgi:hypothetical protein
VSQSTHEDLSMHDPNRRRGLAHAAAAASVFALAPLAAHADAGANPADQLGNCSGGTACKGKGFVDSVSKGTCDQLGGRFSTEDPMKKQ